MCGLNVSVSRDRQGAARRPPDELAFARTGPVAALDAFNRRPGVQARPTLRCARGLLGLCVLMAGALAAQAPGQRWRIKYFYDEDESALQIRDIRFASERRGVAVGVLTEKAKGKPKPVALITSDAGDHWKLVPTKDAGFFLFFVNESLGWMVAEKALYRTEDGGETWERANAPDGLRSVWFRDAQRGWAAGIRKGAWETSDGGKHWTRIEAASKPETNPNHTTYGWIHFTDGGWGIIAGWSRAPRRERMPDWLDPEVAAARREYPTSTILLQTSDGGETWRPSVTSMFGVITRVRRTDAAPGLALIQFLEQFEWPSEVYRLDRDGGSTRVYRRKDQLITDLLTTNAGAYLAGVEKTGTLQNVPIPARLIVLRSDNFTDFYPMDVDYRAIGSRSMLADAGGKALWAATDVGMILKLE